MTHVRIVAAWLFGVLWLTGCAQAPGLVPPGLEAQAAVVDYTMRLTAGYKTLATVSAYGASDIHHVTLRVLKNGSVVATLSPAPLASAFTLRNLRADTTYTVQAEAYSAELESSASLISIPAESRASFTTPAVQTVGGVDQIDDAARSIPALSLKLKAKSYAGRAKFTVKVANSLSKVTHVRITMSYPGQAAPLTRTMPLAEAAGPLNLTNLKHNTIYTLLAEGLVGGAKVSDDSKSTLVLTTAAAGPAEEDLNILRMTALFSVPCAK